MIFCASTRAGFGHVEVGPAHALASWNDWTYWLQPVQRHAIFLMSAILYFLPENLTRVGFTVSHSLLYAGACTLVYCGGMIPTMFFVDTWGRRMLLLTGSVGLVFALARLQYHVNTLPVGPARDTDCLWAICQFVVLFVPYSCFIRLMLSPSIMTGVCI